MDKFWENYIATRPDNSEGAFDAFKQMHQDPRSTIPGPRNMYAGGQLVTPSVDGSRPGYGGFGGNIRLSSTGNAYDVAVKRGDEWFHGSFHKDDYKNKSEALKAAKKFRDQKKKIFYKTGVQEPKYGPTSDIKEYKKKRYEETKELTEAGKLAKDRETKLKNFIGKKKKIKASVLKDYLIDDLGYEKYDSTKIKKKLPNLIIEYDLGQGDWEPLNKQEKTIIKDNFDLPEGQKKWGFDKHRYGISSDKHSSLWNQIKRRLEGPAKYTLAINPSTSEGWAMSSMERVLKNELKNKVKYADLTYQPIKNKKGIIVGFIDNTVAGDGNTYYGLKKNAKEYGDGTEWRAHGDFDRIKKFIKIANGVKAKPDKLLQKILDDKGISELTKGKRSLTLNDILSHERYYSKLSEISPKSLIRRQIVLHHTKGVGDQNLARAAATKDIQLLTDAINTKVTELENIVKGTPNNPARKLNAGEIQKLKNYGAKIVDFDGRVVGGGYLDPEKQFANIEKGALKYAKGKDFSVKTVTSYLERLGCGKAAGGRILMNKGGSTLTKCAQKGINIIQNKNIKTEGQAKTMLKIAEAGSKSKMLRGLLGVWGLGGEAIIEAGIGAYKVLGQGVPADIAWSESYWSYLDPRKYTGELSDLRRKDLEKGSPRIAKYFDALGVLEERDYHSKWVDQMNPADPTHGRHVDKLNQYDEIIHNFYGGPEGITKMMEKVQPEVDEAEAVQAGRWAADAMPSTGVQADRKQKQAMKELMASHSVKTMPYKKDGKPIYEIDKEFIDTDLKTFGDIMGYGWTPYGHDYGMQQMKPGIGDMQYNEDLGYRELIDDMIWSKGMENLSRGAPNMADGGRAGYMGGGIASILKPSEIPPERQGLRSIMINAKDN